MSYSRAYLLTFECDCCGDTYTVKSRFHIRKSDADKDARKIGWSIGKTYKCPECRSRKCNEANIATLRTAR